MLKAATEGTRLATLLLVDDEENILRSLQRSLRHTPYQVLCASDGLQALELLQSQPVDVVVSDSRMPGMDGPSLLTEVQRRWPDTMRIMLTGYSDMAATIKAINEGRIYCYISKPWDDVQLRLIIDQALELQRSERERMRLQDLTYEQNLALQDINAELELKVQQCTSELTRANQMLSAAHTSLKESFVTATQVFSSLISHRVPPSRQTNNEVVDLVRAFCRAKQVEPKLADDLAMAAALYNLGKLAWNDALIALPTDQLPRELQEQYRQYPKIGEALLMALEPAQDAAAIIRSHQERWDGKGFPDGLAGEAIPWGSRILKMAVDFVELQMGMIVSRRLSYEEVAADMPKYGRRLYDPALCHEFAEVACAFYRQQAASEIQTDTVRSSALLPGMEIARDLHAPSGVLLLKKGTQLTDRLITRLLDLEENEGTQFEFHICRYIPPKAQDA